MIVLGGPDCPADRQSALLERIDPEPKSIRIHQKSDTVEICFISDH
jgi:hypothetical protein